MKVLDYSVQGFCDLHNKEYQKHLKAVKFCLENELSFPKETSEFFQGKIDGDLSLENFHPHYILSKIENGVMVDVPYYEMSDNRIKINVNEIPENVDSIIIRYDV